MTAPSSTTAVGWTPRNRGAADLRHRPAVEAQAALRRPQHAQHPHALVAIGARTPARGAAFEEVLTLLTQRLLLGNLHVLHVHRARRRDAAVHPGDVVAREHQLLAPRPGVVEHQHAVAADQRQLLFLERVQPTDVHVGAHAARERHRRQCGVGHPGSEHRLAQAANLRRQRVSDQRQNHRQVVRGEAPEDVLLLPEPAEVEPVRGDVPQPSQLAAGDEPPRLPDAGVVLQKVAHHQDRAARLRRGRELLGFLHVERNRFLDEHVLAGVQRRLRQTVVVGRRRRDRDLAHLRRLEHRAGRADLGDAVAVRHGRQGAGVDVAYRMQRAQLVQDACEIAPPAAGADQSDVARHAPAHPASRPACPTADRNARTTRSCSASVRNGWIGRLSTSRDTRSAAGKSPGACPRSENAGCSCRQRG